MRASFQHLIVGALLLGAFTPAEVAAQGDSVTAGRFRKGQWGAEFIIDGGPRGLAALRFNSPTSAWRLAANLSAFRSLNTGPDATGATINLQGGKRWYGLPRGKIRAYHGLGLLTGLGWAGQSGVGHTTTYQVGAYGEIGAQVFITDDLSLGGRWSADAYYSRQSFTYELGPDSHASMTHARAGIFELTGAFYF